VIYATSFLCNTGSLADCMHGLVTLEIGNLCPVLRIEHAQRI